MQLDLFDTTDTQGNNVPLKKCSCCKELLPYSAFGKNKSKSLGLACTCKACLRESNLILKELHDKHILPENHVCPICKKDKEALFTGSKRSEQPFRLDHDKKTGEFRGFLCDSCNTGLGKFGDSLETLQNAVEYLSGQS
jgi:hypothetical protein